MLLPWLAHTRTAETSWDALLEEESETLLALECFTSELSAPPLSGERHDFLTDLQDLFQNLNGEGTRPTRTGPVPCCSH